MCKHKFNIAKYKNDESTNKNHFIIISLLHNNQYYYEFNSLVTT
jgi:hypothetical protein